MGEWIVHYYKSWFDKPPCSILRELQHYESEEYPFDKETFDQYEEFILSDENTNNMNIDTEDTRDNNHIETVKCVDDWKVIVERWINLTKEEDEHMQYNLVSLDESEHLTDLYEEEDEVMHQDYLIHPTDNLGAKWKLTDIFVDSLVQPDSIHFL
ncbi:7778_t:CDS:2, partial [Racocetra fulgida]